MARAADRLGMLGSQDALILLRASFGTPRVQHLLRCSPSSDHPGLGKFDEIQRDALSKATNACLQDCHWNQASLPLKMGGLGLRQVSTLALPSYLASSSGSAPLQEVILERCPCPDDDYVTQVSQVWCSRFGTRPTGALAGKQSAWDLPVLEELKNKIWDNLHTRREKAVFLAASAPHSGAWLSALPLATCGLRLDDEAVRVGVALRLGLQLCIAHECRCGTLVDVWGTHAMVCKHASARQSRHSAINDIIARAVSATGVPISKEPLGIFKDSLMRPDGITLVPWSKGKNLAWDATIASSLADSYIEASSARAGSASESAANRKESKYSGLLQEYIFQPVALESLGVASSSTALFLSDLGRRISLVSGESREELFLRQSLSVCLQRFNSILLFQSFAEPTADPD